VVEGRAVERGDESMARFTSGLKPPEGLARLLAESGLSVR